MATLKKLEMKRADYVKTEKTKNDVEKLESQMMVASQAIDTTSAEIIKLRETELYPQLIELVKGLVFFLVNTQRVSLEHTRVFIFFIFFLVNISSQINSHRY